jgi:hypothetical protein
VRAEGEGDASAQHVLVVGVLETQARRMRPWSKTRVNAEPDPEPAPVSTGRATIIDVAEPLADEREGAAWLERAGEDYLQRGLEVLDRTLHAHRLVMADPYVQPVGRRQLLVARVGYGAGEQVADGQWADARELVLRQRRQPRQKILEPQARLAALLAGRERPLACEELVLRARLDLDAGREREAALGLLVALDAAVAELSLDPTSPVLAERLAELRGQREAVTDAAQAALAAPLPAGAREAVEFTIGRIEAALRHRAVASA